MSEKESKKAPGPFSVLKSVLAAMIGVQSDENRERDFTKGRASHFIFMGVVMTVVFVLSLIAIVNTIIENSGH